MRSRLLTAAAALLGLVLVLWHASASSVRCPATRGRSAPSKRVRSPDATASSRPSPRRAFRRDRRVRPRAVVVRDAALNYVYGLLTMRPELLRRRTLHGLVLGDSGAPGLGRAAVVLLSGERDVLRRRPPSMWGQLRATAWILRGRRLIMRATDDGTTEPNGAAPDRPRPSRRSSSKLISGVHPRRARASDGSPNGVVVSGARTKAGLTTILPSAEIPAAPNAASTRSPTVRDRPEAMT